MAGFGLGSAFGGALGAFGGSVPGMMGGLKAGPSSSAPELPGAPEYSGGAGAVGQSGTLASGGGFDVGSLLSNPLVLIAIVAAVYFLFLKD